jgi:hypothetical protein
MKENRFHCCASCKNFQIEKKSGTGKRIYCERLGFDTKPAYQFNCWDPKERVVKAMRKEEQEKY